MAARVVGRTGRLAAVVRSSSAVRVRETLIMQHFVDALTRASVTSESGLFER